MRNAPQSSPSLIGAGYSEMPPQSTTQCCKQETKISLLRVRYQLWGVFSSFWEPAATTVLQVHIPPSPTPEPALPSASPRGLSTSHSFMSTVNTCVSSDNADNLHCLGLFPLWFFCFLGNRCSKERPVCLWLTRSSS